MTTATGIAIPVSVGCVLRDQECGGAGRGVSGDVANDALASCAVWDSTGHAVSNLEISMQGYRLSRITVVLRHGLATLTRTLTSGIG